MDRPRIIDNDSDAVSIMHNGKSLREWEYTSDAERRMKMRLAHAFMDGWMDCAEASKPAVAA